MKGSGKKIRELCQKRGITQKELARKAGVSKNTISNAINERGRTSKYTFIRLAKALGCEVKDINPEYDELKPQSVGERIQRLYMEKGITQEELASKSGVSRIAIVYIINNHRKARRATLMKIAKALEVNITEINPDF